MDKTARARWTAVFVIASILLFGTMEVGRARSDEAQLAVVRLHAKSYVAGPDILLGEIADIQTEDDHLLQQLATLSVGRAPLPGQRRDLHPATVQTRMRQQRLPVGQIVVEVDGPEVAVYTKAATVTGELLAETAHGVLSGALPPPSGASAGLGGWALACTPPAAVSVAGDEPELHVARTTGTPPGIVVAMVDVVVDGKTARTVPVRCDADWEQDVLVAAVSLKRHDVLEPDLYEVERRGFTSLPREGLLAPGEAEGWRLTRPVTAGTVLTRAMIEPIPVIRRGDRVNIVAATGGILVTAPGVALADGGVDEMIRVENTLSGHVVEAYVVDEETVSARLQ